MVRTVQHPKIVVQENTWIERISKLRPLLHGFIKSKDQAPFSLNDLPEVPSPNTTVSFSLSSISIFKDYIPIRVFNGDSQTIAMTYAGEGLLLVISRQYLNTHGKSPKYYLNIQENQPNYPEVSMAPVNELVNI